MKVKSFAISCIAGFALASILAVPLASADGIPQTNFITVTSGTSQYSSQVVLDSTTPLTALQVQNLTQSIDGQNGAATVTTGSSDPSAVATPSAVVYGPISCSSGDNLFTDFDGTFGVRNNCPSHVFNWHFRLSSYWRAAATSLVTETGMGWLRNGNSMPTGAHHLDPADYLFHGTLNPVYVGDEIFYTDHFDFAFEIAGVVGNASVLIHGYLEATA